MLFLCMEMWFSIMLITTTMKNLNLCSSKREKHRINVFLWGYVVEPIMPSLSRLTTQIKLFEHHFCGDIHTLI